ncbi:MAG: hypothetical protein ACJ74W_06405 [Pyrinomonadaceae bacterium]
MKRYIVVIPLTVALIFVLCLARGAGSLVAVRAQDQRGGCAAAVARLQQAVTAEAYTYADARRTLCQFMSLSEADRGGRPQAINDAMQQKLATARKESAAASNAARGCDTSGVKRSEVFEHSAAGSVDAYEACIGPPDLSCYELFGVPFDRCHEADRNRRAARVPQCMALLDRLDCAGIKVVEQDQQPEIEQEPVVTVPADLKPECRAAYLQFKTAEHEYERARRRERELAPNYAAAGPRGVAIYNAARADVSRAAEKQSQAQRNLENCKGVAATQPARPCEVNLAGTYTNSAGTSTITISGNGSALTATEEWAAGGRSGTNNWSNCQVTKSTSQCDWTGDYRGDPDKTADRSGTVTATLNGATLTGTYYEAEPKFHWNVAPYSSAIHKGATFPFNHIRAGGAPPPCEPVAPPRLR